MEMELWYCPKCDRPTGNYRTCKTCGTEAVYQRFACWPIPHPQPLPECYLSNSARKNLRDKRWKERNRQR